MRDFKWFRVFQKGILQVMISIKQHPNLIFRPRGPKPYFPAPEPSKEVGDVFKCIRGVFASSLHAKMGKTISQSMRSKHVCYFAIWGHVGRSGGIFNISPIIGRGVPAGPLVQPIDLVRAQRAYPVFSGVVFLPLRLLTYFPLCVCCRRRIFLASD